MKKYVVQTSAIALALSISLGVAHAAIVGGQSVGDPNAEMAVGESTVWVPWVHQRHKAGFGTSTSFWGIGSKVDFGGVAHSGSTKTTPVDGVTVYQNHNGNGDTKHSSIGSLSFVQVADADVWYGEWKNVTKEGKPVRQVYYVGDDTGTTIPTSGYATYTVHGINRFDGSNVMTGTFQVDYDFHSVSGSLENKALTVHLGGDVSFNDKANPFRFSGSATATPKAGATVPGKVVGHFFGANAASLAGFAQFDDQHRDYDTAFGGTKK